MFVCHVYCAFEIPLYLFNDNQCLCCYVMHVEQDKIARSVVIVRY